MRRGRCSACGAGATLAPSGRWYHDTPACPNRSWTIWQPMILERDGTLREATDAEKPARFVEGP